MNKPTLKMSSMKKFSFISILLLVCHLFCFGQTTVNIAASADNTIYSEFTGNSNGAGEDFTAGRLNRSSAVRRGLLKFDFSSIPAGAIVTAASLTLVLNKTLSGAIDISLHKVNVSWGEGSSIAIGNSSGQGVPAQNNDATWLCSSSNGAGGCITSWTLAGGDYQVVPTATTAVADLGAYVWSGTQLLADVQQWVNNSATNYGWLIRSDEIISGSAKRFASRTNSVVTDRPSLSVTYTTTVPVTLVYFKASAQKNGSLLQWQTSQEINNQFFEIEQSTDGLHFNVIGKMPGAGNSSLPLTYQFTHQTAAKGKQFYRIGQTDLNGYKTYSKTEVIQLFQNNHSLLISPNPVMERMVISNLDIDASTRYCIIDNKGRKIIEAALRSSEIILPANLPAGVYQLRITGASTAARWAAFIKR
jgi:hypothetical protein